jgi:hypothetical protein
MESNLAQPCSVSFWTFAGAVLVGNMAMLGVGVLTDALYKEEPKTKQTAAAFAKIGAFWLAAGLAWIAFNRRNGEEA